MSALIARYEYYEEQKKKAIQDEDTEAIAGYIAELKKISGTLRENRTELQGFFEDLSASGESGPDLDDISQKIKLIDRTLFTKGQNLFHFIDSNALKDDKKRLVDLAESGHLTEKELSKSFSNVGAYLKENGLTYEDLISVIKSYKKELQSIPDKKTNVSYSDTITTLKEMSDAFSALDNAYAGITDNSRSITFENLSELSDKFKNVAGIEKYVKAIQDAKGNAESAQKAFNNLASAYINHTGILENVNDQNKELIALYLQEQGIVNADVLVEQAYRDSKIDAMAANFSFTGSVDEQVKALTEEINCLGLTGDASIQLATAVVEAQTAISNAVFTATKGRLSNYASEIQSIKSLQEAQGTIADIKSQVQTAMGGDNWAADLGGYHGASQDIADTYNSLKTVENAYADIEEIKASLVTPPVYGKNISTVKDASGSSGNTNKFSEKLDSIDHKLELSKRRLNDYNYELEKALTVSRRNTAIDNIVRESAAQIKDLSDIYAYYSKKADEALAQIPESLREDIKNGKVGTIQIDNQNISRLIQQYYDLDSAAHDAATQIRELGQSINDMKKKKIEVQIEGLERAKSKAERIKSQYESAISAVTSSIQSEMDHVNDYYDDHTKRIQDQIDALDEQNDKLEMQNRLEQALYDIRRAENQRTSRIYREGQGFVYEADQNAVRDSRQSYDDAVFDQAKYDLQQILDGLEKERDEEIEYLSDIMDAWNGIADSFERMADVEIADDVFGGGWLDEILSGNTDLLDEMSENFGDVFGQIADSEKAIEALDNLLEQIESGELSEDNALTIMNGQISELGDNTTAQAEVMGQGYHSIYASAETAKDLSAETYAAWTENLALFQEQSLAVCNSLVSQFNSMADAIVEAVKRAKEAEKELNDSDGGRDEGSSSSGRSGSSPGGLNASMHHKGILSGTFGKSATGDDRVRELTRLSAGKLKFNEVPVIGLKDEIALTKEQQDTLLENIKNMSYPQYHIPSMDYGQFQPSGANTQNNEYVFNGGINISEAQNVTDIAKGITNGMLKQALHQELYKR